MSEPAFKFIETFPGIVVAVIDERNAEYLLRTSYASENNYMAGLVKFSKLTEYDCSSLVAQHSNFGFFEYPIISKELASKLGGWDPKNHISTHQKWKESARDSLISACYMLNNLFDPDQDYIYIKIQTEFAF